MAIYMWREWMPGDNTIAYYPLTTSTTNRDIINNKNLSNTGVTFSTVGGIECASFSSTSQRLTTSSINAGADNFTIRGWVYSTANAQAQYVMSLGTEASYNYCFVGPYNYNSTRGVYQNVQIGLRNTSSQATFDIQSGVWYHYVFTRNGTTHSLYVNGEKKTNVASATGRTYPAGFALGGVLGITASGYGFLGRMSNVLLKSIAWSDNEVLEDFNLFKSDYGY